ncbi:hypothetical protein V3470_14445 [Flavobacterium oreochromis]|uniref:Uncharacterized protein n=1 Tax=Flavobacterium oreochromis TaxID=2906078 RepID=A0ABW8PCV0_9FLAO|nr:hypothetical protein [Flavobacterium oreochromis]OWP77451.1 hypothetical protein BWG23_04760 [Flavobacterium oreochromis]
MNLKNKNSINLIIGLLFILLGYFLYLLKNNFWHYLGLVILIYGTFVTIVKILKMFYLAQGKYKNIWKFEDSEELNIKGYTKEVLQFRIKNNKEVTFEVPHFGLFSVINYNDDNTNEFSNSQKLKTELNYFIKDYCYPVISFGNIIPLAINHSYGVLFLDDKSDKLVYLDLDNSSFKPLFLDNKLEFYLNIKRLVFKNDTYYYNGLIKLEQIATDKKFFYDVPDCIFEGKDYIDIFNKCFNLLDENINYSIINIKDSEDKYTFEFKIENHIYKTYFQRFSDYIDSEKLIIVLNEMLSLAKNSTENKFYLISNQFCDFGVVLANNYNYKKLKENGCIEFDYESQKFTEEEKEKINKYSDFTRQVENIEFYIKVAKKSNKEELKKSEQYHLSYPTDYFFDEEELKIIRERLNVILVKKENEYEIFFRN